MSRGKIPKIRQKAKRMYWWMVASISMNCPFATCEYSYFNRVIYKIGPKKLLKRARAAEMQAIQLIEANTSIPVPRVFDILTIRGLTYVVMERIEGSSLDKIWNHLSSEERACIARQVGRFVDQLRALPPPHAAHVQSLGRSKLHDPRMEESGVGPFNTVKDFQDYLGYSHIRSRLDDLYPDLYDSFNSCDQQAYQIKCTHGDLAPRNIIVRNGKVVAILDWECAGWYPEYWEYTSCYSSNLNCSSFWAKMKENMKPYTDELHLDSNIASIFDRY